MKYQDMAKDHVQRLYASTYDKPDHLGKADATAATTFALLAVVEAINDLGAILEERISVSTITLDQRLGVINYTLNANLEAITKSLDQLEA